MVKFLKEAFAIITMCDNTNNTFGITVICNRSVRVVCCHGKEVVTCPNCGSSSTLQAADSVDLSGGGF